MNVILSYTTIEAMAKWFEILLKMDAAGRVRVDEQSHFCRDKKRFFTALRSVQNDNFLGGIIGALIVNWLSDGC